MLGKAGTRCRLPLIEDEAKLTAAPRPQGPNSSARARGITVSISLHAGPERKVGFERLRDTVARHRRAWAERYLDTYLHKRWETELREAARMYNLLAEERQKPPVARQFAGRAAVAVNHWFGGDLTKLYAAIGEKCPVRASRYTAIVPVDRSAFAAQVFAALGGQVSPERVVVRNRAEAEAQAAERQRYNNLMGLALESHSYLQLEEVLGRPPTLKEFGPTKFEWRGDVIAGDVSEAWRLYTEAVEATKQSRRRPSAKRTGSTIDGNADAPRSVAQARLGVSGTVPTENVPKANWLSRLFHR